ncbi:unnamed protein product, partial [Soboliphyme baturini]|uniref:BTB domain-containing protein n=1 Tax=Soboliphyme baturini TaxID=241478 RepID=A0A183IA18_9BILA
MADSYNSDPPNELKNNEGYVEQRAKVAFERLRQMRDNGESTDVRLVVKHEKCYCSHRIVLSAVSNYFRHCFTSDFVEKNQELFAFPEVDPETIQLILDFSYGHSISLDGCDAIEVLKWADYFQMSELTSFCTQRILEQVTLENCVYFARLAMDYNFTDLKVKTRQYVCENFSHIRSDNQDLMALSFEQLSSFLSDDHLNARKEKVVWSVIKRWIYWDRPARKVHLKQLLTTVRLGVIDETTFKEIRNNELVQEDEESRTLICSAYAMRQGIPMNSKQLASLMDYKACYFRLPYEVIVATGGWSGDSPSDVIEAYDPTVRKWYEVNFKDVVGPSAYHGTIVIGHHLYNVGGFNGNAYYNMVRRFDILSKVWSVRAPMAEKRCYVNVAEYNGSIYAFGGVNGFRRLNSAECYRIEKNQWLNIHPMEARRSDAHAVTIRDKIVLIGGFNGN